MDGVKMNTKPEYVLSDNRVLKFKNRLYVLQVGNLWKEILKKTHYSRFSIHPSGTKMYKDMRQLYWWLGLK